MEFQDVVRRRRMVRQFDRRPVPEESLRNAVRGPSAGFSQGQEFLVLRGETELARFVAVAGGWMAQPTRTAPLVVVPLAVKDIYLDRYAQPDKGWTDRSESHWPVPYWYVDTGMATLLILQTVVDEGLGAVFFGMPPEDLAPFRAEFGVPPTHEPIGAIAIGHPHEPDQIPSSPRTIPRRPDKDVFHYGLW